MDDFTWSVCYPDAPDIENKGSIDRNDIVRTFEPYDWPGQLEVLDKLEPDAVHYQPSIRFTNNSAGRSLELTAEGTPNSVKFSLWFERPVTKKILFGLFGEKDYREVVDKWDFTMGDAVEVLTLFAANRFDEVEARMT